MSRGRARGTRRSGSLRPSRRVSSWFLPAGPRPCGADPAIQVDEVAEDSGPDDDVDGGDVAECGRHAALSRTIRETRRSRFHIQAKSPMNATIDEKKTTRISWDIPTF